MLRAFDFMLFVCGASMNKYLLALLATAALCVGTGANAAPVVFDLSSPSGLLGTTQGYTNSGLTITAAGFDQHNSAIDLYGKHNGGDENGLGLSNDTSEHEIQFDHGYVQIDVSALFGHVSSLGFLTGSTTDGEKWAVYGSNSSGVCGAGYSIVNGNCGTALQSGTTEDQVSPISLLDFGTFKYYDFVEISHVNGDGQWDTSDNILLTSLTATTSTSVPEPATWLMFFAALSGIGLMMRRKRAKA
jgi:hypothetical protein